MEERKLIGTRSKKLCPNCGREIQTANFSRHYKACTEGYKNKKTSNQIIYTDDLICPFCEKISSCKNAYAQHYVRCSKNPDKIPTTQLTDYIITNRKGKNKFNCPDIAKQVDTVKQKYSNGFISPLKDRDNPTPEHIFEAENQLELQKWFEHIKAYEINKDYSVGTHNSGYRYIKNKQWIDGNTVKILFEHAYIANMLLDGKLSKDNVVHHLDEDKTNNIKENLIIFADRSSHTRYHNSKYARLIYDPHTFLFTCYIDEINTI